MDSNVYMWVYLIGIPITIFIIGVFAPRDSFFESSDELTASEAPFKLLGIALVWPVWPPVLLLGFLVFVLIQVVRFLFDAGNKCLEMCTKT